MRSKVPKKKKDADEVSSANEIIVNMTPKAPVPKRNVQKKKVSAKKEAPKKKVQKKKTLEKRRKRYKRTKDTSSCKMDRY